MRVLWNLRAWALRAYLIAVGTAPEKVRGMDSLKKGPNFRYGPWPSEKFIYRKKLHGEYAQTDLGAALAERIGKEA